MHRVLCSFVVLCAISSGVIAAQTTGRLHDVDAFQSDATGVLKLLAQNGGVNLIFAGAVATKVTLHVKQVSTERAIELVTRAAGLAYKKDGDTFVVGSPKDIETAYPAPRPDTPASTLPPPKQAVYQCRYVSAADVVVSLEKMFSKNENIAFSLGPGASSPRLDGGGASSSGGSGISGGATASTAPAASSGNGGSSAGAGTRTVVFSGDEVLVDRALALAQRLDIRRAQVRINVRITDIATDALRDLGVQWSFGGVSFKEGAPPPQKTTGTPQGQRAISFGSFTRTPLGVEATLSALQQNNRARLLAAPTLSLLDGERGSILIGDRLSFPVLVTSGGLQGPTFDIREVEAGIRLQVAVQMEGDDEMTLTIYPQVSVITGYLNVNGASYPQISTREQQTTIRVKNGEQIVVGGLIRDEELKSVQTVPILSKIPLFGELFTFRKNSKRQSEVVILIAPQILKD